MQARLGATFDRISIQMPPQVKAAASVKAAAPTATTTVAVQPAAKKPRLPAAKPVLPSGTERHTADAAEVIQQIVPWATHFAHDAYN